MGQGDFKATGVRNRKKGSKDHLDLSRIYSHHLQRRAMREFGSWKRGEHAGCDKGLMKSPYFKFLKYKKQIMSTDLI